MEGGMKAMQGQIEALQDTIDALGVSKYLFLHLLSWCYH